MFTIFFAVLKYLYNLNMCDENWLAPLSEATFAVFAFSLIFSSETLATADAFKQHFLFFIARHRLQLFSNHFK